MKKEQMVYIGLGLFVVFVFMLVTMNSRPSGAAYNGYTFNNNLANSAGYVNSSPMMSASRMPPRQSQEGFLVGTPLKTVESNWRIEDYLDDSRGPECAAKSFGITASGGPLCLTAEQARAMTSRGFNTDDSGCLKNFYK